MKIFHHLPGGNEETCRKSVSITIAPVKIWTLYIFRTTLGCFYIYQPDSNIQTVLWVQVLVIWVTLWIKTWLVFAVVIQTQTHTHTHIHVQSLKFIGVLHIPSILYSHKEQDRMFWEHDGCKTVNTHAHGQQETVSFVETVVNM
jgi:hypothetical protein